MFYTCSLELAAVCSPSDFLGIPAAVLSKSSPILSACCSSDSVMVCFQSFKSPTTFGASTVDLGRGSLRSWLAASRAKTSALPGKEPDSLESVPDCGPTLPGSLARWNPSSSSWRTRQRSLTGGLIEFSETLPRWDSMRNGELFQRKMPSGLEAHRLSITSAKESGSLVSVHSPASQLRQADLCQPSGLLVIGSLADLERLPVLCDQSPWADALPTPGASKACNDTTLTCSGDGRDKPNKLGWAVASVGTPTASNKVRSDAFADGRTPTIRELISLPTPHGFGHGNGPSGNELGFAVNRLSTPTPRSSDGKRANSNPTDKTARRVATGQANLSEFIVEHPKTMPTPTSQDAKNATLPVSQTDRDSIPGQFLRSGESGSLNPDWVEWLMNWPIGWTSLEPMSADTFDEWFILVQMRAWHHVEPPIPRTARDIPNRVARLKAIGNGQVPLAAYLAWMLLLERFGVDTEIPVLDHV